MRYPDSSPDIGLPHLPPTERWTVGRFCLGDAGRTEHMVA